jgi:LAO/AO transport system kinase
VEQTKSNHYFDHNRKEQSKFWLLQTIEDRLKTDFFNQPKIKEALKNQLQLIEDGKTTPFVAAEHLLSL